MQLIDQTVDGVGSVLFSDVGQAGIACGGAGVAEQILNMTQAQALFEQVGSHAVTKGMDGYFFTTAVLHHGFHGGLGATTIHVRGDIADALGRSDRIGKQQLGVAMLAPQGA